MGANFANLIRELGDSKHYVLLSDTDHEQVENRSFINQPEHFAAMKQAGYDHLVIEMPEQLNKLAQEFQRGEVNRYVFSSVVNDVWSFNFDQKKKSEHITAIADMLELGRAHGIKVHFGDPLTAQGDLDNHNHKLFNVVDHHLHETARGGPTGAAHRELLKLFDGMKSVEDAQRNVARIQELLPQWADSLTEAQRQSLRQDVEKIGELPIEKRLNDQPLADTIQRLTGGGKAVILFGVQHGIYANDLDEMLGQERTARIIITPSAAERTPTPLLESIIPDRDPPYGTYYTREDRFVPGPGAEAPAIDMTSLRNAAAGETAAEPPKSVRRIAPAAAPVSSR